MLGGGNGAEEHVTRRGGMRNTYENGKLHLVGICENNIKMYFNEIFYGVST
jgi:hypothetical protein